MTGVLKSLVDDFDVVLSSAKQLATLEMGDTYHAKPHMESMHTWAAITQQAKNAALFARHVRNLDAVFQG